MKKILIIFGVISLLAVSTIAQSATGFIDPDGDVGTPQWSTYPASPTNNYPKIDDGIRQPDAGDVLDYNLSGNSDGVYDVGTMTSLTGVGSISNITLWFYGNKMASSTLTADIYMAGGWVTPVTGIDFGATDSWKSASFDAPGGGWTQADLDAIQYKYTLAFDFMGVYVYSMYGVVTYEGGGEEEPSPTGQVVMISDDGEGAPPSGYNYDYVSVYPPVQSDDYVKATAHLSFGQPYYATNPTKPLIGTYVSNCWYSYVISSNPQCFHIDLGSAKTVTRIYYENYHDSGSVTNEGIKDFTFYGSNTEADFLDLVYADTGTWTQLTTSQATFDEHISADQPDPKYITVTNSTAYQYYGFKFPTSWGGLDVGVRRIELQIDR